MSMARHMQSYVLWVLCVDDETYEALDRLELPNVRRLKLSELEVPELSEVKLERTIGEYCWTLTPFAPRFVFEADLSVERVTYIDADLWFQKHPKQIFDEFESSGKHVLITEHAYSPEYDSSARSGRFCVQFMTFTRHGGERVRHWWEERCIEWCHAYYEDGKFGDQMYLDQWPEKFSDSVHILGASNLTLAPWNVLRFPIESAVFYHFHGLRILSGREVEIGRYCLPKRVVQEIYGRYLLDIRKALVLLKSAGIEISPQAKPLPVYRRLFRVINRVIIGLSYFSFKDRYKI